MKKFVLFLLLSAALILAACTPQAQPAPAQTTMPEKPVDTPAAVVETPEVLDFADPSAFEQSLLQALNSRDAAALQSMAGSPFVTGAWRGELAETAPADALNMLLTGLLRSEPSLSVIENADLTALMGDVDPLTVPPAQAGVTHAFLVGGWGMDGLDEAVLFAARQPDDTLQWRGWMTIPGGFSGARLGGLELYSNEELGFRVYLPPGTIRDGTNEEGYVPFVAPPIEGAGHPGVALLSVDPADGRTAEDFIEAVKADHGPGFNIYISAALNIDGTQALVVNGISGQDVNRQLFMVRGDRLYHIHFAPDDPHSAVSQRQMLDLYAQITNTFHFID